MRDGIKDRNMEAVMSFLKISDDQLHIFKKQLVNYRYNNANTGLSARTKGIQIMETFKV